jgi:hypothetical protein
MLEDGDLERFLVAEDETSERQKERLVAMLDKFIAVLSSDAVALQRIKEEGKLDQEP